MMPAIPGKAFTKQLPFLNNDDGIFEPEFIEERRLGLEEFLNKVSGHPLVQGRNGLAMTGFLSSCSRREMSAHVPDGAVPGPGELRPGEGGLRDAPRESRSIIEIIKEVQ